MIIEKVNNFIDSYRLISPGDKIVAACSGGADSLALVDILHKLTAQKQFLLAVAHVDHMFRGEESAADARFVKDFCRERGLVCHMCVINVPQFLSEQGGSAEDIGRKLRYQFLAEVAKSWGEAKIATGHHSNDQAETLLMHLFRGAGAGGLAGIKPKRDGIIRPLLPLTRQEIEDYCMSAGIEPRLDSTNLSLDYFRNRIRLAVLPYLERELGIGLREPLCRTAVILAEQQDYLVKRVQELWPSLVREQGAEICIAVKPFREQHLAIKRLLFRQVIEKKLGSLTGITFQHVETLIEMAETAHVGGKMDLPGGWRAERGYHTLRIGRRVQHEQKRIPMPGTLLNVPDNTEIHELGIIIKADLHNSVPRNLTPPVAVFDNESLHKPLFVRTRQPGDRFSPRGMQGEKKLKDFFIDKKIARDVRDCVPIFCDSSGQIFWLGGLRGSRLAQVTSHTKEFLSLQIIGMQEVSHEYDK